MKPQKFTVECGMNATVIKISRSGVHHFGHTLLVLLKEFTNASRELKG